MRRHPLVRRTLATALAATVVGTITTVLPTATAGAEATLEAESMVSSLAVGGAYADSAASGGHALLLGSNGVTSATTTTAAVEQIVVRARGDQCSGAPQMELRVDGALLMTVRVSATRWSEYTATAPLTAGAHQIAIAYTNDHETKKCDRNLRLDRLQVVEGATGIVAPTTAPTKTVNAPTHALQGASLYVDPYSHAAREAAAMRSSDPTRAALFDKLAGQSQADWVGDWIPTVDLASNVDARVTTIAAAGAVPVLVAYAIPLRDCGSYSAGGISTPAGYRAWVGELAKGIAGRKAAVILEPDALGLISCLTAEQQQDRFSLLAEAVATLTAGGASVYLDAGHSAWLPAETMAARLQAAGVAGARGFSLNVSNFQPTTNEIAYGRALGERLGGKAFVVDTSRNGAGPYGGSESWCNPPERALGERPTTSTGVDGLDGLLWIKRPGESDGTCRGGPPAGTWWPDYAAGLAQLAAF